MKRTRGTLITALVEGVEGGVVFVAMSLCKSIMPWLSLIQNMNIILK